jgi:23S rRNA (guanosine2251-2'-O)-methyltransferase
MEKLLAGEQLEKVLLQKGLKGDLLQELKRMLKAHKVPISLVPPEKLNRLSRQNHQGAIAFTSPIRYLPLEEIITQTFESGQAPLFLMLDGVTDVRNVGSIARTAECIGVHALILPTKGSAQINADAVKTSAGALHHLPVCREPNLEICAQNLKASGIHVLACTEKVSNTVFEQDLKLPLCLVMGSEDNGVSPELLHMSDAKMAIPLRGKIGSLNVGAATAMILMEVSRQRSQ